MTTEMHERILPSCKVAGDAIAAALGRDASAADRQVTTSAPSAAAGKAIILRSGEIASARWISPWSGSMQMSWMAVGGAPSLDDHSLDAANPRDHRVWSDRRCGRDRIRTRPHLRTGDTLVQDLDQLVLHRRIKHELRAALGDAKKTLER